MRKSWIIFAKKTWLCYIRGKLKNMKKLHLRVLWLSLSIVLLSGCNIDFHSEKTHVGANTSLAGSSEIGTWQNNANIATGKVILNSSGEVLQYKFRDQYDAVFLPDSNGSMIVKKWEKFGLISQSGSVILEVSYQKVQYEQNGCYLFDDGFVLPDGSIIRLADHPKLQLFQPEPFKDNIQLRILDSIWEKVIFEKISGPNNTRSVFVYNIREKNMWLPPVYSSIWKVNDNTILALHNKAVRILKTDGTVVYESLWYTGWYRLFDQNSIFRDGVLIMQNDQGLYGLIREDGTWFLSAEYNMLITTQSGTMIAFKWDNEWDSSWWEFFEITTKGDIRTMDKDEWLSLIQHQNMHPDFIITQEKKLKNKKTWEIFDSHDSIRTNMDGSHIALKKWDKWWIYGFDDYRYDNILFWIATHGGGFMLSDGLAIASREHTISRRWNKTVLLNANSNKEIFTFDDDDEGIFLYGEAQWFFQINRDMIAVRDGKIWKIINKDGQNISDWFSELSLIQDREMIRNMSSFEYSMRQYLLAKKENKSILLVVENEITREHTLTLPAWSAKWNNGVISLYDVSENQTFDDQKCFRNPEEGTAKCLQEIQKMKEKKPSLLGYAYPDGYEKSIVLK